MKQQLQALIDKDYGILDFNLTLNFGRQWPEMKDFAYETRDKLLATLYNWEHIGALALGAIVGVLLTTVIFLALRSRRVAAAMLLALTLATSVSVAQDRDRGNGREPQVDLITIPYVDKNFGSKIDGAGMCVFNSFRGCLVSQYREDFDDYARWLAANYEGGGYPSRVTEYTRAYCRAKRIEGFDEQYVQVVGEDTVQAIEEALEDGRAVAVTDSGDESFYGRPVPHMTNIVYLDERTAGIVDNNRPDRVEWISREAFLRRHRHFDKGWCIIYMGKPQLTRPVNEVPQPKREEDWRRRNSWLSLGANVQLAAWQSGCSTCQPSTSYSSTGGKTGWEQSTGGTWYYYVNGTRVGEYHEATKQYYTYAGDGRGRSWLVPTQRPDGVASTTARPTGVLYAGFPELRRGQTLYGYGSLPVADPAAKRLYQDKAKRDRARPRVVVNGSSELEQRVRALLRSLGSDAFVYGREAWEVIQAFGFGQGVTILSGRIGKGLGVETGQWATEPTDAQLREALIKADPSYKPGGGVVEALDSVVLVLGLTLAVLIGYFLYLQRKPSS